MKTICTEGVVERGAFAVLGLLSRARLLEAEAVLIARPPQIVVLREIHQLLPEVLLRLCGSIVSVLQRGARVLKRGKIPRGWFLRPIQLAEHMLLEPLEGIIAVDFLHLSVQELLGGSGSAHRLLALAGHLDLDDRAQDFVQLRFQGVRLLEKVVDRLVSCFIRLI